MKLDDWNDNEKILTRRHSVKLSLFQVRAMFRSKSDKYQMTKSIIKIQQVITEIEPQIKKYVNVWMYGYNRKRGKQE